MNKISRKTIMITMAIMLIGSVSAFGIYVYNPYNLESINPHETIIYVDGIDTSFNFDWVLNYDVQLLPDKFNTDILTRIK